MQRKLPDMRRALDTYLDKAIAKELAKNGLFDDKKDDPTKSIVFSKEDLEKGTELYVKLSS
jgi:hypothetical protein